MSEHILVGVLAVALGFSIYRYFTIKSVLLAVIEGLMQKSLRNQNGDLDS
jgi:hypothetical protein